MGHIVKLPPVFVCLSCLLVISLTGLGAGTALAAPLVFWASDPVGPNETVLLQGDGFGSAAVVEVTRLEDGKPTAAAATNDSNSWTRVPVLQASDCSLKFALPADWKMGVFACRVTSGRRRRRRCSSMRPIRGGCRATAARRPRRAAGCGCWASRSAFGQPRYRPLAAGAEGRDRRSIQPTAEDCYALRLDLPADLKPGDYTVSGP